MKIRDAMPSDANAIAAYWNPQIRDTAITFTTVEKTPELLSEDIERHGREGRAFLIAEDADGLVGHASYGPFRNGPGYRWTVEHTIILDPRSWGSDVAPTLIAKLEDHAINHKIHSLIAGISHENPRAIAFHAKYGYQHVGRVPQAGFKFGRWMDLVLMQKLL